MIVHGDFAGLWEVVCDRCKLPCAYFNGERADVHETKANIHITSDGHHYCLSCVDEMIAESKAKPKKRRKVKA